MNISWKNILGQANVRQFATKVYLSLLAVGLSKAVIIESKFSIKTKSE